MYGKPTKLEYILSSPRAESVRAVTGRWYPNSRVGEAEVEIDRHAEDYKQAIDDIRGPEAKNRFLGQNPNFWAQKSVHFMATMPRQVQRKKCPFPNMNQSFSGLECFF